MNTYLIAHYGKSAPTFTYAETLEEARTCALTLLKSQLCSPADILSIVYVATDSIVYYGKRNELLAKLADTDQATTAQPAQRFWHLSLNES
ncbi:hypothetical protein [Spirosoma utsteinense]|uniref:Uncharacterized protein n=1 Tax=Spirosoma utsteinense TaxID=2585773 RepID=A0ABR6W069_9BACT|nr:hypothetical protein [Spirosoma utsteinense]MBC3788135.1 hypothetical protein [Spirosoma utsteinense]MBC3790004.1 hypothetical protein [Spirosoma utsteinense]